ncbi:hypothetical protein STSP2_03332 [Anaerohalosphaera lusitana]|uniref:Uncharacterized protein n=1 Tax=Anaerohalosphaera lusitana TaxID=1936003 RepID=A0A1U9NQX8_9BACT|nr:hypothetical protein [Anaerohalosphaera lusitana]AQT70128.1 hypothetical protein STSP2_03332 [Anaerohalosphaera lusitana]
MNLTNKDIRKLIQFEGTPCVSIYLPTHISSPDTMEGPIRLKNLFAETKRRLEEISPDLLEKMSKELGRINDMLNDIPFWQFQNHGLAIFMAPSFFEYYQTPISFEEFCYVGESFNVKPLAELLSEQTSAYVLAVNRREVHLYEVAGEKISEKQLRNTMKSIQELTRYDDSEKQLQHHSMPKGKAAGTGTMFHGQGTGSDNKEEKKRAGEFVKKVVEGVERELHADNTPVVLVADSYVAHLIYESNPEFNLQMEHVDENPHYISAADIHKKAKPILDKLANARLSNVVALYKNLTSSQKATDDPAQVIKAAYQGRIDTLLVDTNEYVWGNFDADKQEAVLDEHRQSHDQDLANSSVMHTLMHDGKVYAVSKSEIEHEAPMAAILRY